MFTYSGVIDLDDEMTVGQARSLEETLREYGSVVPGLERMLFRIEATDLWELRDRLSDLEASLNSYTIPIDINRDNVASDDVPSVFEILRMDLEHLLRNGYKPMYNGRPSCPFCENFVDADETHDDGCPLVVAFADSPIVQVPVKATRKRARKEEH